MSEWCFAAKLGSAQFSCADVLAHRLPLQPYPKTGAHACWVSSSVRRERARMVARIRGAFALGVWARAEGHRLWRQPAVSVSSWADTLVSKRAQGLRIWTSRSP